MKTLPRLLTAQTIILMAFAAPLPSARGDELHAGAAVVDITPPLGFPMWGYGARKDSPSVGVLDPLRARAVVLKRVDHFATPKDFGFLDAALEFVGAV